MAARCSNTGAVRLPDRSRSSDNTAPGPRRPNHYASLLAGRVPGLLTSPDGGLWVAERLAWLPVFAIVLSGLWLAFRRMER